MRNMTFYGVPCVYDEDSGEVATRTSWDSFWFMFFVRFHQIKVSTLYFLYGLCNREYKNIEFNFKVVD